MGLSFLYLEGLGGGGGGGLVAKSCPTLATLSTVACQIPLSMGFSRQENWSELPFPSPGDLPDPGIEPCLLLWQAHSLLLSLEGSPIWRLEDLKSGLGENVEC